MINASTKIKSIWIGYYTRKLHKTIKFYEQNYMSVKWTKENKEVMVIGDMSNPPWISKIKMDYCMLRHIHVKYFSKLYNGIYYYNYIVDGQITIAEDQPGISYMGIKCNVLNVTGDNSLFREQNNELDFTEIKSDMSLLGSLFESFDIQDGTVFDNVKVKNKTSIIFGKEAKDIHKLNMGPALVFKRKDEVIQRKYKSMSNLVSIKDNGNELVNPKE